MPRSLNPSRPFQVVRTRICTRFWYYLLSENSYVYHHWDKTWRIRKLNDHLKYCYRSKKAAIAQIRAFFPQEKFGINYG